MQLEGLDQIVLETPGQLGNPVYWPLRKQFERSNCDTSWPEQRIDSVSHGLYKLVCSVPKEHVLKIRKWSQLGWLRLNSYGAFLDSKWLPLGESFVYIPEGESLELWVKPKYYFYKISIELREFVGDWSPKATDIQSIGDVIDREFDDVDRRLDELPTNVVETLTEGEWEWRDELPPG